MAPAGELVEPRAPPGSVAASRRFARDPPHVSSEASERHDFIVLLTDGDSEWTRRCLRQADEVLLVASAGASPALDDVEKKLCSGGSVLTPARQTLVLLHDEPEDRRRRDLRPAPAMHPRDTARWLDMHARAVRASVSIPVALPPVLWNGELLVDGAVFNNFPADVMTRRMRKRTGAAAVARGDFRRIPLRTVAITVGLLAISNLFMTIAWYGHLKNFSSKPWYVAAFVSWGIALFEYLIQVPANRIGFERLSLAQLKIVQEVVTLGVFVPFAVFYMRQPVNMNFVWAGLCLLGAVFFMFR